MALLFQLQCSCGILYVKEEVEVGFCGRGNSMFRSGEWQQGCGESLNIQRLGNNSSFRERLDSGFFLKPLKSLPPGGIVDETRMPTRAKDCHTEEHSWLTVQTCRTFLSSGGFLGMSASQQSRSIQPWITHEHTRSEQRCVCVSRHFKKSSSYHAAKKLPHTILDNSQPRDREIARNPTQTYQY